MSGLSRKSVIQVIFIVVLVLAFLGLGQAFLANLLGVLYPSFMSLFALETDQADDDKQWLTYWVVFGFITVIDQFAGVILHAIPFYYILKMILLVWLFHPSTMGAGAVYDNIVYPFWKEHEGKIEEVGRQIENTVKKGIRKTE